MPQKTFASNKSSLFADGSSNLGGGADDHMPVGGPYSGYVFRSAVRFALDFSGVKRIDKATMRLKTSSQVHVAFSSDPDIYVARATADWTANGSSRSSDGGSGWGTSPTVYPGPASTQTNRVSRDVTTSQNATVDIDITAIARDWLAGNPNYGVLMYYVASGDITEFYSYRHGTSGNRPSLILDYSTDSPPTASLTGPTGIVSSTRPTISGSASDPDGDAIQNVHLEVVQGSTVVYSVELGAVAAFDHVPTVDLPGGALWAQAVAQAGGLIGAASNRVDFTVDRPPSVASWSAPVGAISGNRRPVHTFTATDPDGDTPVELYDVEIYQSVGGAPSGAAVWVASSQSAGIAGMVVNHTPGVDLPGGPLLARSRVRTGPADLWSPWSAYQSYSIALTTPTIAWIEPASPNAFEVYDVNQFADQFSSPLISAIWGRVQMAPPSGQTLTREARGYGYETAGASWAYDGPPQAPNTPSGGTSSQPIYAGIGGQYMYGRGHFRFISTASGGGSVDVQRNWRASILEHYAAVYLGDNVTALSAVLAGSGGQLKGWMRAQASRTDTSKGWKELSDVAGLLAELPAQGAYLGLRSRFALNGPDVDILGGMGSFEDPALTGWAKSGQVYVQGNLEGRPAPEGSTELRITGDGATSYPQVSAVFPVVPGGAYSLEGYLQSAGGVKAEIDARVDAVGGPSFALRILRDAIGETAHTFLKSGPYIVPSDGSVTALQVLVYIAAAPSIAGQDVRCDGLKLVGPKAGAGLDKWTIDWTSAG